MSAMARLLGRIVVMAGVTFFNPPQRAHGDDKAAPEIIAVSDTAKLRSLLGRNAIVKGTVKRVETMKSQHRRVWFTEGEFILFIRKDSIPRHPDWKLDELPGKEIFAGGEIRDYRGRLEIIIQAPDQIANTPEKVDPATPDRSRPSGASVQAAAPGQPPEMPREPPVRRDSATVRQWLAITSSAQPQIVVERYEGTFTPGTRTGAPPLVLENYSGRDRGPATASVEIIKAQLDGWPRSRLLRVRRTEGNGPGLPHGVTVALLLRSMFDGFEIPSRLMVAGNVAGAGSLIGGAEELSLWREAPPPADSWVLIPEGAESVLFDHLIDGNWRVLTGAQIFTAASIDDAAAVARALAGGEWQPLLDQFSEVQKLIAGKPDQPPRPDWLRNPAVRARLAGIARQCPAHVGARVMIEAGNEKLPKIYSTAGSGLRLRQFYLALSGDLKLLREGTVESRRKLRAHSESCESLIPRIDPAWKRFADAVTRLLEAVKDAPEAGEKNLSPREKKAGEELKEAAEAAKSEYEEAMKFQGAIGVRAPLAGDRRSRSRLLAGRRIRRHPGRPQVVRSKFRAA